MSDLDQFICDVQEHKEPVYIIYKSHDRWPLPAPVPGPGLQDTIRTTASHPKEYLRVSVLDSSFNPPTLAHLSLARSKPPLSTETSHPVRDFDARLLLLSVRNADKAPPKPGEATYVQRLEMMKLLAQELENDIPEPTTSTSRNLAVAIIDEPTFVCKSAILRDFLKSLVAKLRGSSDSVETKSEANPRDEQVEIKLSFIVGFDTLERFLAVRYYNNSLPEMHSALGRFFASPPDGDGSEIICSWRGQRNVHGTNRLLQLEGPTAGDEEKTRQVLSIAQPFVASGGVSFMSLSRYESSLSSTEVRARRLEDSPDWRTMVPSRVGVYIEESELYRTV